jgi:hypothetical protein
MSAPSRCVVLTALGAFVWGSAVAAQLFSITDPRGDDDGAGGLLYPNRPDMQPGDLDLVAFSASAAPDGVWFAVEFARPVLDPAGAVTQVGQVPIDRLARHGFYTFNVDVYIDQDRATGSGRTEAVPGRGVALESEFAWERSVVLSPRPDVARTLLELHFDSVYEAEVRAAKGRVGKSEVSAIEARSREEVARYYCFPDRIRVSGRTVEFFVPESFLGAPPQASWGYTLIVTGADIEQLGRVGFNPTDRPKMMTMPVARGMTFDAFGLRSDADIEVAPVIDLLAPEPATQYRALLDYDSVAGRLARAPGIVPLANPAAVVAAAPASPPSSPSVPPPVVARSDSGPLSSTLHAPPDSRVPQADAPKPPAPAPSSPAPSRAQAIPETGKAAAATELSESKGTFAARLRTLQHLLDEGLITREEYAELRRKILSEL